MRRCAPLYTLLRRLTQLPNPLFIQSICQDLSPFGITARPISVVCRSAQPNRPRYLDKTSLSFLGPILNLSFERKKKKLLTLNTTACESRQILDAKIRNARLATTTAKDLLISK